MITRVKSARVSTNTKPRIIAARIAAAAPGLRAMPSQAAEAMRPCPSAPPKAASAMPKPAAMANRPLPPAAAAPVSCANADGAINITAANATNTIIHFFITSSLSSQGLQVQTLKPDELPPGGGSRTPCSRAHTEAANCRHKFTGKARLVLVGRSHAQINRGQHRKDIGLNDGHKDMQADKGDGNRGRKHGDNNAEDRGLRPSRDSGHGKEAQENRVQKVARNNVGPEADSQGENAGRSADDFNGKKQNSQRPIAKLSRRTGKREQVAANAVVADALPVEIQKRQDGACQRNRLIGCRGGKNRDGTNEWNQLEGTVVDILFEKILDAETERVGEQELGDLLHRSRLLHGKARTEKEGQERGKNQNHNSHHDMFRDGSLGVFRRDMKPREQCQGKLPEVVVHQPRQSSNVFGHSLIRRM